MSPKRSDSDVEFALGVQRTARRVTQKLQNAHSTGAIRTGRGRASFV